MRAFLTLAAVALLFAAGNSQITIERGSSGSLDERIRSAAAGRTLWVGYAITRLMEPRTFVSSQWKRSRSDHSGESLEEALSRAGDPQASSVRGPRHRWSTDVRVMKRVALLIRMDRGKPVEIDYQTTDLPYDSARGEIRWVGQVEAQESVDWIGRWCERLDERSVLSRCMRVLGLHQGAAEDASTLLRGALKDHPEPEVRRQAAQTLAEFPSPENLAALSRSARHDPKASVAKSAVWSIGAFATKGSTDTLINLLRDPAALTVRSEIIQAIANDASERVLAILTEVIDSESDADVRRMAVWSLAQLKDGSGVPHLISLAQNSPNPTVRKAAIQALAQARDPRAEEALIAIVRSNTR